MKIVWIVDDDDDTSKSVALMVKLLNYQTKCINNARSAARIIMEGEKPDLVLLDINMPEVSGFDLLEFMQRNPATQPIPVIFLSSEAADLQIERALNMGARGYLVKPVSLEELELQINQVFR